MLTYERTGDPVVILKGGTGKAKRISVVDNPKHVRSGFTHQNLDPDGAECFQPIPNSGQERDILTVFGKSGSGKSYYIMKWLLEWKKTHKGWPIYVFSEKTSDPKSLDLVPDLVRIKIGDNLLPPEKPKAEAKPPLSKMYKRAQADQDAAKMEDTSPLTYKDFERSCVVMDDIDGIMNKDIRRAVYGIMGQVAMMGRSSQISLIFTCHKALCGHETSVILRESHAITLFPRKIGHKDLVNVLDTYFGMDKKQIEEVRKIETSRWITVVTQTYPSVVFTEKQIYIPGKEAEADSDDSSGDD